MLQDEVGGSQAMLSLAGRGDDAALYSKNSERALRGFRPMINVQRCSCSSLEKAQGRCEGEQ